MRYRLINIRVHDGKWHFLIYILLPGIPDLLYGTEIALNGGKSPENQPLMNFKTDQDLVEYITKLADIRCCTSCFNGLVGWRFYLKRMV